MLKFIMYTMTECTVVTTTYKIPSQLNEDVASIPIGKPCANYQVMILDENMNLCPIGVPGELYIDSVGLAKGILISLIKQLKLLFRTLLIL